jgi:hypothetical protein
MPTMAGRARPIEKFAEAAGKCSMEVRSLNIHIQSSRWPIDQDRLLHMANALLLTTNLYMKTCVPKSLEG